MNAVLTEPMVLNSTMGFSMIVLGLGSGFLEQAVFIFGHFFQHFIPFVVFYFYSPSDLLIYLHFLVFRT